MQGNKIQDDVEELYKRAQRKLNMQKDRSADSSIDTTHEHTGDALPFFIQQNSLMAKRWKQKVQYYRNLADIRLAAPPQMANNLASAGKLTQLKQLAARNPHSLTVPDENGWQPIHEAARSGNVEVLEYLIGMGVDVNARTNGGRGGSALWWAEQNGHEHESVHVLKKAGALRIAPNSRPDVSK